MTAGRTSPSAPLRIAEFRLLWFAGLAMNLALWMQAVGASWLMLSLAPTPLMVALIQTAQSLPTFVLGLPGGVLADLVNRRLLILFAGGLLCLGAVLATAATAAELDELTRVVAGIAEVQAAAEKVSAFTSRAKPPVDPALLQRGKEEIDSGKMKSPEQIRGGPEGQKA